MPLIATQSLTKRYPGGITALDDLTVELEPGIIGLVGANGAGKSTLLRILLGLLPPTSGGATVLGYDVRTQGTTLRRYVGYMPESDCLPPDVSATDFVGQMARWSALPRAAARERAAEVLRHVGLHEERYRPMGAYSTGMKQRVKLAQALVHDPRLLLLDEPTNGLDPAGIRDIRDMIRGLGDSGVTVLLSSHILAEVQQVCHSVSIIGNGRLLASGNVDDLVGAGAASTTRVRVADQPTAATHLERAGFTVATNGDGALHVEGAAQPEQITRVLAEQGMYVSELTPVRRDLESVFLQLTKDNTIAATVGAE
jgi:ABC-2 type transport system ATP-binding protein